MNETADTAQVIIRPPLAWGLVVIAGLALNWLVPLPFLPADLRRLARLDGVCHRAGAVRLGYRYYYQGWFERPLQAANHHHRRERTLPLHAQPHLPRHVLRSGRLGDGLR